MLWFCHSDAPFSGSNIVLRQLLSGLQISRLDGAALLEAGYDLCCGGEIRSLHTEVAAEIGIFDTRMDRPYRYSEIRGLPE
jgi:hypothetical protein